MKPETQQALEDIAAGDKGAYQRLFARYDPMLRRAIARRLEGPLRARVDPSDIIQETHLAAFGRIDEYLRRRPMPIGTWLLRTAEQCLAEAHRRHCQAARRSVAREQPLPDRSSMLLVMKLTGTPPRCPLEHNDMGRRLQAVLDRLPKLDREILILRRLEGLSNGEAAARLRISPSAARKRFARALLRAQQALREGRCPEASSSTGGE